MAVTEYMVIAEEQTAGSQYAPTAWSGAAAGCEIAEPSTNKPIKKATTVRVQAESAEEAIRGVKELMPTLISGTTYAKKLSELTSG